MKNFKRQCKRKQRKVSKVYARNYLYKNYDLSRKKKIYDSDLCDNELSDFEDDDNRSVEKIVEIRKTLTPYQFEQEQEASEIDEVENEQINEYTHQYWCNDISSASV